jgi:hypothetical protein
VKAKERLRKSSESEPKEQTIRKRKNKDENANQEMPRKNEKPTIIL